MDEDKQSMNSTPAMSTGSFVTPSSGSGLTHPFFSNHPSQTFNTDAGDIILAGAAPVKPKFNKKPLIIGGIIAAVLVVVGVVMVAFGTANPNGNTKIGKAHRGLYTYGNYLINGSKSDQRINENLPYYSTYFYDGVLQDDDPTKLVTEAERIFNSFYTDYQLYRATLDEVTQNILDTSVDLNSVQLEVLQQYLEIQDINEVDMLELYLSGGSSSMVADVTQNYAKLFSSNTALLSTIAENKISLAEAMGVMYDNYTEQGCLNGNSFDDACLKENTWSNEVKEQQSRFLVLQQEIINNHRQLLINVIDACMNTISLFNNFAEGQ